MKLFFASDLHGSTAATELMLARFEASRAHWLILLGDLLYHGPRNPLPESYNPAGVAALLNPYASGIIAVRGNCDSEVDQMLLAFSIMNESSQVLLQEKRLFLTHGHIHGRDNVPALCPGDILVSGHTHLPKAERVGDIIQFNPGSTTLPKGGYPASFGLLSGNQLSVMELQTEQPIVQIEF